MAKCADKFRHLLINVRMLEREKTRDPQARFVAVRQLRGQ